jgi:predicted DNA-binding transcriptional regulator YafY
MREMERQSLVRISLLDQQLRSRPYTSLRQLMAATESSRRTVFRDLNTLMQMGAPIASKKNSGYYYVSGHNWKMPEISLTEGDLLAILLAEQAVVAVDKGYLEQKMKPCLTKLRLMFQNKIKIAPDKVFSFARMPQPVFTEEQAAQIEKILKAIGENKVISCEYKSAEHRNPVRLTIEPHHLHFRGKWYLFGWSGYSQGFRTYAVQRMSDLQITKDTFGPRDFDHEKHLGSAWGIIKGQKTKVVLDFAAGQAVFLKEKLWHPSQKLTKQRNGKIRMTLTVDGLDEIFWWILSYGSLVKVVAPAELAKWVKQEVKSVVEQY